MRKSGLQKQISSIFNEAPIPIPDAEPTLPPQTTAMNTADVSDTESQTAVADAPKPSLAQRMAEAPTEAVHTPAAPTMRPRPLARTQALAKTKTVAAVRKATVSTRPKMDAHQKKMTVMVGVLSVVFAVVLFISLGGLGQTQASTTKKTDTGETAQTTAPDASSLRWQSPQPLPETLRDPMKTAPKKVETVNPADDSTPSQWVVKGIVFSKNRPTALVNETIVAQGESVNGVTIVSITREAVEFEKDGKRWTQTVQR